MECPGCFQECSGSLMLCEDPAGLALLLPFSGILSGVQNPGAQEMCGKNNPAPHLLIACAALFFRRVCCFSSPCSSLILEENGSGGANSLEKKFCLVCCKSPFREDGFHFCFVMLFFMAFPHLFPSLILCLPVQFVDCCGALQPHVLLLLWSEHQAPLAAGASWVL